MKRTTTPEQASKGQCAPGEYLSIAANRAAAATEDRAVFRHLWAALKGFEVQYGESIATNYPDLPRGHVERVDALAAAAREVVDLYFKPAPR